MGSKDCELLNLLKSKRYDPIYDFSSHTSPSSDFIRALADNCSLKKVIDGFVSDGLPFIDVTNNNNKISKLTNNKINNTNIVNILNKKLELTLNYSSSKLPVKLDTIKLHWKNYVASKIPYSKITLQKYNNKDNSI